MPKNRKEYSKQYAQKNYTKLRAYKTNWAMKSRDRERLIKIKKLYFEFARKMTPLLKNIKE